MSKSPLQRLAQERLQEIYDHPPEGRRKSWQAVEDQTGINKGQAWKIRYGKTPASKAILKKLRIGKSGIRRTPWKKKYLLIRKYFKERNRKWIPQPQAFK